MCHVFTYFLVEERPSSRPTTKRPRLAETFMFVRYANFQRLYFAESIFASSLPLAAPVCMGVRLESKMCFVTATKVLFVST